MKFTGNELHSIELALATQMTLSYRQTIQDGEIIGGYFSKSEVQNMLDQESCIGFRYYYGLESDTKVLVLVGVGEDGNDLVNGIILERAIPCPNQCSDANELNS